MGSLLLNLEFEWSLHLFIEKLRGQLDRLSFGWHLHCRHARPLCTVNMQKEVGQAI
jgi:hypothetical protein